MVRTVDESSQVWLLAFGDERFLEYDLIHDDIDVGAMLRDFHRVISGAIGKYRAIQQRLTLGLGATNRSPSAREFCREARTLE